MSGLLGWTARSPGGQRDQIRRGQLRRDASDPGRGQGTRWVVGDVSV